MITLHHYHLEDSRFEVHLECRGQQYLFDGRAEKVYSSKKVAVRDGDDEDEGDVTIIFVDRVFSDWHKVNRIFFVPADVIKFFEKTMYSKFDNCYIEYEKE